MINYDLKKIKALVFDVDGVLSAETICTQMAAQVTVNIKDGYALQLAVKCGLHVLPVIPRRSLSVMRGWVSKMSIWLLAVNPGVCHLKEN